MFGFRLYPLFDEDGGLGAGGSAASAATEPASASPSVEAGAAVPGAGDAPAPGADAATASTTVDVATQESFATRLREEREKLAKEFEPYKQSASAIDRIAKAAGFQSADAYLEALDAHVQQQVAAQEAQRLGVDQETYDQYFRPVNQELAQTKQQLAQLQQAEVKRQVQSELDQLKTKYPDFEQYRNKTFDLAIERGYRLEDAYIIASHADKLAAVGKETEQNVLANLANREARSILPGNDKPGDTTLDVMKMSAKDIADISRRVQNGERITL